MIRDVLYVDNSVKRNFDYKILYMEYLRKTLFGMK